MVRNIIYEWGVRSMLHTNTWWQRFLSRYTFFISCLFDCLRFKFNIHEWGISLSAFTVGSKWRLGYTSLRWHPLIRLRNPARRQRLMTCQYCRGISSEYTPSIVCMKGNQARRYKVAEQDKTRVRRWPLSALFLFLHFFSFDVDRPSHWLQLLVHSCSTSRLVAIFLRTAEGEYGRRSPAYW
jgi:hypothetical protein